MPRNGRLAVTRARRPAPAFVPAALDDESLARRAGAGDDGALAELYGRYHQGLYRYCLSLVGDEDDARDALQETFVKALGALRREVRDAPLRPWLYRIAHNEAMSVHRRRPNGSRALPAASAADRDTVAETAEPGDRVATRAELAALVADLAQLTNRQRSALTMRELNGLSHAEIASALSISPNAAKQAIFEARSALNDFAAGRDLACSRVEELVRIGDRRRLRSKAVRAHLRDCEACRALRDTLSPPATAGLAALLLLPFHALVRRLAGAGKGLLAVKPVGALVGMTCAAVTLPVIVSDAPAPHRPARRHAPSAAQVVAETAASRSGGLTPAWRGRPATPAIHGSSGAATAVADRPGTAAPARHGVAAAEASAPATPAPKPTAGSEPAPAPAPVPVPVPVGPADDAGGADPQNGPGATGGADDIPGGEDGDGAPSGGPGTQDGGHAKGGKHQGGGNAPAGEPAPADDAGAPGDANGQTGSDAPGQSGEPHGNGNGNGNGNGKGHGGEAAGPNLT